MERDVITEFLKVPKDTQFMIFYQPEKGKVRIEAACNRDFIAGLVEYLAITYGDIFGSTLLALARIGQVTENIDKTKLM